MRYPAAINNLINQLSRLPSVGPKTAERYVFYLLNKSEIELEELSKAIGDLKHDIVICPLCLAISETSPCAICADKNRQPEIICIVENIQDLIAIEATKQFTGRYFVLGGLINTIEGIGPEKLNINKLAKLIQGGTVKELIIALNFTLEGETTSLYLSRTFKDKVKITRLAKGLPSGSDLEYVDPTTLTSALKYRNEIK